jgi:hypothetical protein
MRDSPDSNNAAVTMAPAIGMAAVALVLLMLLSFVPLCEFISSIVTGKELNRFCTLLQDERLRNQK